MPATGKTTAPVKKKFPLHSIFPKKLEKGDDDKEQEQGVNRIVDGNGAYPNPEVFIRIITDDRFGGECSGKGTVNQQKRDPTQEISQVDPDAIPSFEEKQVEKQKKTGQQKGRCRVHVRPTGEAQKEEG